MTKRYESLGESMTGNPLATMEEANWGTFVLAEDFDDLVCDYEILEKKYNSLVKKLGNLYQEA